VSVTIGRAPRDLGADTRNAQMSGDPTTLGVGRSDTHKTHDQGGAQQPLANATAISFLSRREMTHRSEMAGGGAV